METQVPVTDVAGAAEIRTAEALPSGRSVVVRVDGQREELLVRSPTGEIEVRITLTESGPVVRLHGGRLELEGADTIALNSRRLELTAREEMHLHSGGDLRVTGQEMHVQTEDDVHLKGKFIRLN
jgi:hypothetical protein